MLTAVYVLIGTIVGLATLIYASFLAARYFFVQRFPDEVHYTTTSDGWRLAVTRYRPRQTGTLSSEPVLLVHGIAANRYNLDHTDELSLARFLAERGYDVWMVELRGRGLSSAPRLFSGVGYEWTFDDYCERDLPAAVGAFVQATAARRLHLVGFSTGALASYAWLSDPHREIEVISFVSIGGAGWFKRVERALSGRLLRNLRWLRHRWMLRVLAPISGYLNVSPLQLVYNSENIDGPVLRRALVNTVANFSRNELLQYSDWILNDQFRSIDHRRDYRAELPRISVPTLFLAGARDMLSTPDMVKATYEAIASGSSLSLSLS